MVLDVWCCCFLLCNNNNNNDGDGEKEDRRGVEGEHSELTWESRKYIESTVCEWVNKSARQRVWGWIVWVSVYFCIICEVNILNEISIDIHHSRGRGGGEKRRRHTTHILHTNCMSE